MTGNQEKYAQCGTSLGFFTWDFAWAFRILHETCMRKYHPSTTIYANKNIPHSTVFFKEYTSASVSVIYIEVNDWYVFSRTLRFSGYTYAEDYYKDGGYICPSDIYYGRPKRAINTYGKWKVIVNLPDDFYAHGYGKGYEKYTQTQRLEQCM